MKPPRRGAPEPVLSGTGRVGDAAAQPCRQPRVRVGSLGCFTHLAEGERPPAPGSRSRAIGSTVRARAGSSADGRPSASERSQAWTTGSSRQNATTAAPGIGSPQGAETIPLSFVSSDHALVKR